MNYTIVIANKRKARLIRDFLASTDLIEVSLSTSTNLFYLAASSGKDRLDDVGFFKGYAIDHDNKEIVFSGSGVAPSDDQQVEGCFIKVNYSGDEVRISNDIFAQLSMLYFGDCGVAAISDSLFVLTELRRTLDLPVKIDSEVMVGRSWLNGAAAQLLNERTPIRDVYFATPGTRLRVAFSSDRFVHLSCEREPIQEVFQAGIEGYRETIREGAYRTSSVIRSLLSIAESDVSLALSAGLDSRVCFAAGLIADTDKNLFLNSNKKRQEEYQIASRLATEFGYSFSSPTVGKERAPLDRLSLWFLTCAGIYDPLHSPRSKSAGSTSFAIGGHGAELYKGNYGWRAISTISRYVPDVGQVYRDQCEEGLSQIGVDPKDKWGSEWHYLAFRNAIHSGRSTMSSLLGVRPLLQRKLVGLSRASINEYPAPRKGDPSIVTDLLIAMNPNLAKHAFDDDKKNLSGSYVDERSLYLGHVDGADVYKIFGSPDNVKFGCPKVFQYLVGKVGLTGNINLSTIPPLVDQAIDVVPRELRACYEPLYVLSKNELKDPVVAPSRASMATGKLLTFLMAR